MVRLQEISFSQLNGWAEDNHADAMKAFLATARCMVENPYKTRALGISSILLRSIANKAIEQQPYKPKQARAFFEQYFYPCEISANVESAKGFNGFITAYFEPEVRASREMSQYFTAPLYARPENLLNVAASNRRPDLDSDFRFARNVQVDDGFKLAEYPDRAAIEAGCLAGQGLEIAYVKDKVEALFIHIQGSARLRFDDGSCMRIGYAAKTGHPYTAIGNVLLQRGELTRRDCGMQAIRDWFVKNPEQIDCVINQNRSFIFFQEYHDRKAEEGPVGAAKVSLVAGRSLAVDRTLHTFGTPVWIETAKPLPGENATFNKLMIAQDTGSAITGPARGDVFLGSGERIGKIAGDVRHSARFVILVPRENV